MENTVFTEELQISRGSFALAFSVKSVCAFFSNLLAGNVITNYGCRRTMSIALLVSAGGLALFATSQNVLMLILGATLLGISDGFCKLIIDKKQNVIIGATLLCTYASEIIYPIALMIQNKIPVESIKKTIFPHPTVCEIIREAIFSE